MPADVPFPLPRPADLPGTSPAPAAPTGSAPQAGAASPGPVAACNLSDRGAGFAAETLPPISEGACGIPAPVRLKALAGGVALSPAATLGCDMARALDGFVTDTVQPLVSGPLKAHVTSLEIATSYQCRSQNHVPGAKLSEHAFGNAVDLVAIHLSDGRRLAVGEEAAGSPGQDVLEALRKAACSTFTTVLGPGSDAEHGNHFHLDLRRRSNGYRICQ